MKKALVVLACLFCAPMPADTARWWPTLQAAPLINVPTYGPPIKMPPQATRVKRVGSKIVLY